MLSKSVKAQGIRRKYLKFESELIASRVMIACERVNRVKATIYYLSLSFAGNKLPLRMMPCSDARCHEQKNIDLSSVFALMKSLGFEQMTTGDILANSLFYEVCASAKSQRVLPTPNG